MQFQRPALSNAPTDEQQKRILELFLGGHSLRGMSSLLNWDVSDKGIEKAIRDALVNLIDITQTLTDTLEGMSE